MDTDTHVYICLFFEFLLFVKLLSSQEVFVYLCLGPLVTTSALRANLSNLFFCLELCLVNNSKK